ANGSFAGSVAARQTTANGDIDLDLNQEGNNNRFGLTQEGKGGGDQNGVQIDQLGDNNRGSVRMISNGDNDLNARFLQDGNDNFAAINMVGGTNVLHVNQSGDRNEIRGANSSGGFDANSNANILGTANNRLNFVQNGNDNQIGLYSETDSGHVRGNVGNLGFDQQGDFNLAGVYLPNNAENNLIYVSH